MRIVIPTYRRVTRQITLRELPPEWRKKTTLVCDSSDAREFERLGLPKQSGCDMVVVPKKITTIASKRAWIIDRWARERDSYILMLDDDLRFSVRDYTQAPTKLVKPTVEDVGRGLRRVGKALTEYAHVGISTRQGNNRVEALQRRNLSKKFGDLEVDETIRRLRWLRNYRMVYALGYDCAIVEAECKLGRIEHREDMDYCLQLLRKGWENRVLAELTVDQVYNSRGGASEERSMEASNADAEKLAKLHKGFVKVVDRAYLKSVPRKEVVVQWKKAYESSK